MDAVFSHRICGSAQFEGVHRTRRRHQGLGVARHHLIRRCGSILNQGVSFDGLSPLETCSGTYIYGLSGDCATTIATSSVAIFIFIAVYLFAAIIVAYWQRARRITVSMMHERNDALQAKEDEERHIAALAERARIARDMHDVVAHTLSIIIIQSDGAGTRAPTIRRWPGRPWRRSVMNRARAARHETSAGRVREGHHADYVDVDALIDQARAAVAWGARFARPCPASRGSPHSAHRRAPQCTAWCRRR